MTSTAFRKKLRARFKLSKSGAVPRGKRLVFAGKKGQTVDLSQLDEVVLEDSNGHFRAEVIMRSGSCEVIHVSEPGPYFDRVFFSDHSRLYALEYLEDPGEAERTFKHLKVDRKKYASMSKVDRIKSMPFVRHQLASSLEEFLAGIEIMTNDELEERTEPGRRRARKLATGTNSPFVRMREGDFLFMVSRKERRRFMYITVNDKYVVTKTGKIGRPGRITERYKKCASFQAAVSEAEALIASGGFKVAPA